MLILINWKLTRTLCAKRKKNYSKIGRETLLEGKFSFGVTIYMQASIYASNSKSAYHSSPLRDTIATSIDQHSPTNSE